MRINSSITFSAVLVFGMLASGCADSGFGMQKQEASGAPGASSSTGSSPTATAEGGVPAGAVVLSGTCNAQAGSYAVGKPANTAMQSELITRTLAKTLRVIRPGEAVTRDFSSQRLNLEVDSAGNITAVRCG